MRYQTVIGVEVHAELSTESKVFCGCSTKFGAAPNTQICPVCTGQPGALPKLNEKVVAYAIKLGLALNCAIARTCNFDRKNYFYPDLPKGYQISQLYFPICTEGHLTFEADGQVKKVGIREIHIEEDAGKLSHAARAGGGTRADYNRSGVPLLEIVTYPDFRSGGEVAAFIERLREIMLYLEICDCKMQEGSLRADINLSLNRVGEELGTRTETKNLNSIRSVLRAVNHEQKRQADILDAGQRVIQETRRWDDDNNESFSMRGKENARDYRYFPEPDLPPLHIAEDLIEEIQKNLPEFAHQKRLRYTREFGLPPTQTEVICRSKTVALLFERICALSKNPVESANLITGDLLRLIAETGKDPESVRVDPEKLAYLIGLAHSGKINRAAYRETVEAVFHRNAVPAEYIAEKGLSAVGDETLITKIILETIAENPAAIADYRAGKDKAFGFLMGTAMKKLSGKGDPAVIKRILSAKLEAL